jgi:hypothetical protein
MDIEFKTALLAMACLCLVMAGIPVHAEQLPAAQDREATAETSAGNASDEQQKGDSRPIKNDLEQSNWFIVTWENDLFVFNDDGYTNGISVGWGHGPYDSFEALDIPNWIRALSGWTYINGSSENDYAISYVIAQAMYTPTDISDPEPILDDRPYAGTLTWEARIRSYDAKVADSLGLTLGFVGPVSLAEQSQKFIHKITGSEEPQGWDNQIGNEPVFRIGAEHINRLMVSNAEGRVEFDTNLYLNGGFGNLRSDVGAGFVFRVGTGLDQSFAYVNPAPARGVNTLAGGPSEGFEWQVSLGIYGRYVFNDITIDGNTFKDSLSAELEHDQYLVGLSMATSWRNWGFIFSVQRGTDTFVGQDTDGGFGTLSVTYNY